VSRPGEYLGRWEPFGVAAVRDLFEATGACWWLSGGVALDLFLGYESRPHSDIDVSVRRSDWDALAPHLAGRLDVHAASGGVLAPLRECPLTDAVHNLWAREHGGDAWRVQVNLEPGDDARWYYRRDRRVSRAWRDVIVRDGPVPYVNPAVQLLWKAKTVRPHDQADFDAVYARLRPSDREWLSWAIAYVHPASPWCALTQ
jgi:hypothetical protein